MTPSEFSAWLDGFLTGKLSDEDIAKVRAKAFELQPAAPYPLPYTPAPYMPGISPTVSPYDAPWLTPTVCKANVQWADDLTAWNA